MSCVFLSADRFAVAPMVDITISPFRRLARIFTRRAMLYTPMIVSDAVCRGRAQLLDFFPEELPLTLQLGGCEPARLAAAAREGERRGYTAINLNAGCPSSRVQAGAFGAVLMKNLPLLCDCFKAMRDAVEIPVSVKTRIGVDSLDSPEFTLELAGKLYACGCRHLILHARKVWLKGLSPKENRSVPPLDYERIYAVRRHFPGLLVTLNGGLKDLKSCLEVLKQADGVMLGRAVVDNPYLLASVDREIFGEAASPKTRREILTEAEELCARFVAEGHELRYMARPLLNLFCGCRGSRRYRRFLSEHLSQEGVPTQLLEQAYAEMMRENDARYRIMSDNADSDNADADNDLRD